MVTQAAFSQYIRDIQILSAVSYFYVYVQQVVDDAFICFSLQES